MTEDEIRDVEDKIAGDDRPWVQSWAGLEIDLLDPDPSAITLEDTAHALAHFNRFGGHARGGYSVAQHSVLGVWALRDQGHAEGVLRAFWGHDCHEASIGDTPTPIKRAIRILWEASGGVGPDPWARLERRHELAYRSRFRLPRDMPEIIKTTDQRMCATEARDLMARPPKPWRVQVEPFADRITIWPADVARTRFLDEAARLGVY